jgi:hypothetical protein
MDCDDRHRWCDVTFITLFSFPEKQAVTPMDSASLSLSENLRFRICDFRNGRVTAVTVREEAQG